MKGQKQKYTNRNNCPKNTDSATTKNNKENDSKMG